MSFFAVTVETGKEATHTLQFDLRISQAVLPANATDKGRSFINAKVDGKTFALAALKLDLQENASLDLIFEAGSEVSFSVTGKNPILLSGYYMNSEDFSDDEGMYSLGEDEELDEIDDDEIDEDGLDDEEISSPDEQEITKASLQALVNNKRKLEPAQANGGKKAKAEPQQKAQQQQQKAAPQKAQTSPAQPKAEQKPQTPAKGQQQAKGQSPNAQQQKPAQEGPVVLSSGLKIEVLQQGIGAVAKPGNKVGVSYVGRLQSGKKFDESKAPFKFKLGAGDVIKGWDQGVAGMKIGERRKLTIPAGLAYGKSGSPPDIPPNATLVFEVQLHSV